MDVYKESFKNAGSFNFYFAGSFEVEKMKPLLKTYLGSLPSTGEESNYIDLGIRSVQGPLVKDIKKGSDRKSSFPCLWKARVRLVKKNCINYGHSVYFKKDLYRQTP